MPILPPQAWTLQNPTTVATIAIRNNEPVITHLESSGREHDWAGHGLRVPLMPSVGIRGVQIPLHWKPISQSRKGQKLVLVFKNASPKLRLESVWQLDSGHGPLEHTITIANQSGNPITVSDQDSLTLQGLDTGGPADLWWTQRGSTNALTEGGVIVKPVISGLNVELLSNNHDDKSPVPWMAIQVGSERGLYVGWEFSGLGGIRAAASRGALDLHIGNQANFKTDIQAGKDFLVPGAFVGCYEGDVEDGSYNLGRYVIETLRPPINKTAPDPMLNCNVFYDAGGNKATEKDMLDLAKRFQPTGVEMFLADAMWFPQIGDWRWDPARFPHGVKPIEQYVHSHGMKLGLWCAWSNGGASDDPGALSVNGPYGHPDWFSENRKHGWKPDVSWVGDQACMGCPDAQAWVKKKVCSLVRDQHLDYFKTDTHPIVVDCNKADHLHKYGVDVSYWATLGAYDILEALRKTSPNLILENCSGACHIKDYGMVRHSHNTVITDTLSNLPDRAGVYDSTYVLPPLVLQAYTSERNYGLKGDDPAPYLWRSGMMCGWQIDPVDSGKWTPAEWKMLQRQIQIYKHWIRPILRDCKVHHVLPRPDGTHWDGLFYWSEPLGKGTFYVFRPGSPDSSQTVRLKGLKAKSRYKVWSEDGSVVAAEIDGAKLMHEGITPNLPTPYSSDLVYIQELKN